MFIRDSFRRIFSNSAKKFNIKLNILESNDGVETLYLYYISTCRNIKISAIFSDENMNMMNGLICSELLYKICNDKGNNAIPFYLVTSCQKFVLDNRTNPCISEVLNKPILVRDAERILTSLK